MGKKIAITCFLLFSIIYSQFAQESAIYTNDLKAYQDAVNLYNNKQYQAAQSIFMEVKKKADTEELEGDCAYYIANCAVRLNQIGADELMEDFVTNYPTSTKRNSAYKDVADYYFNQGKYAYALKWYDKVSENSLTNAEKETYYFNNGYALFTAKKYEASKRYFNKLVTSQKYGSQAKYYIGYMAYEGDDYNQANEYFDQIQGSDQLNEKLSYYQADMNFKLGNFEKALALALDQLEKTRDRVEISELHKIAGESLFNLKRYDEAIPHLEQYKGKQGKWNNTDYYQLGYAYYQQKDYEKAIGQFNKIIDADNIVAQNAYYHLAECYLETDKKQQALNAFRNAYQMNYNEQIQQDAMLNYARLSYEIGNPYESVPALLTSYLKTYPDAPQKQEIEELLVDSYITSKNYEAALDLLEKNRSYSSKETYQKVAFYRGVELFNEGSIEQAKEYFTKSLKEQHAAKYTAKATFWKAETNYRLGNYNEALIGYKQFAQTAKGMVIEENVLIDYNIGYTYFKQKNYDSAVTYFNQFIATNPDVAHLNDAYLRLGDSYFVSRKYWPAMETYNKAIALNGVDADYAHFQKAISYGFVDRNERKIEELNSFVGNYPKSAYADDALFSLANVYIAEGQTAKGIAAYDRLVSSYPSSSYVPKALQRQGLNYYKENNTDQALVKFKTLVAKYPNSQEAVQSVPTVKAIYIELGRVNEYGAWAKELDFVEVTDAELDKATYDAAENQYVQNKIPAAQKGFETYLKEFPTGSNATPAHFYLAQILYSKGEKDASVSHYEYVSTQGRNTYTEQSLVRLSEIYIEKKAADKAIQSLKQLETVADYPQNITYAQSNLMKLYYENNDYEAAVMYAEKVLANPKIDNRIKSDAHVMIARSAIKTNNMAKAKTAYAEVQKIATGALAAEALYYDAYFKNIDGAYEASNAVVQKLGQDYSGYKQFTGKGLIVMAKNYYALDDAFQATYILDSLIKNFTDYPAVVTEAQKELNRIKTEEAKRNASVSPEGN